MSQAESPHARYQLRDEIGRGGFATVHRAYDRRLEREVALKRLRAEVLDPQAELGLKREALAIAALQCPGIVTIYDVLDRPLTLVLELVDGGTVADRILHGRIPLDELIVWGRAAATALGHAHRHGYVHRDVKPHNLLIDGDGVLRVTDFGLVRHLRADTPDHSAQNGLVGTPSYMSPEQIRGLDVGPASDQFSLCVVLYQCATGVLPFSGIGLSQLSDAIQRSEPSWPEGDGAVDGRLRAVLSRGLAKEPHARYAGMAELGRDLAAVLGPAPVVRGDAPAERDLVGRRVELRKLQDALAAVMAPGGRGRVVLLSGEAGIGKTTLVDALLAGVESVLPARHVTRCAGALDLRRLVRAFGSIGREVSSSPSSRPYRELLDVELARLATIGSFVVVIEDLHDAGSDALEAIRWIVDELPSTRGLLIVSHRPQDGGESVDALVRWLRTLEQVGELALSRFDAHETAQLVRRAWSLDREPDPTLVAALHQSTEGIPLFIRETLRYLRQQEALGPLGEVPDEVLDGVVPERVRHILEHRIERVEPELRTALDAAAIEGDPFHTDTLAMLLEEPRARVLGRLQRLARDHALIEPTADGYRFTHSKFRDVVSASVLPELREEWHGRLADALLAMAPDRCDAIAQHLHAAGRCDEAIPHQLRAAAAAQQRIASHEARRFLSLATGTLAELGRTEDEAYQDGLVDLGRIELLVGNREAAREAFDVVLRIAPAVSRARGRASYNVGRIALATRELETAQRLFDAAVEVLRAADDPIWQAASHEALAVVHRRAGRLDDALRESQAALALREAVGFAEGIARSRASLGAIHLAMARFEDARTAFEDARRYFAQHADSMTGRADYASAWSNEAATNFRLGRIEAAIAGQVAALAIRRRLGDRFGVALSLYNLADAQVSCGLYAQADENADEALQLARALGDPAAASLILQVQARVRHELSPRVRRQLLIEAVDLADVSGDVATRVAARRELAWLDLGAADTSLAAAHASAAERLMTESAIVEPRASIAYLGARIAEAGGYATAARLGYQRALELLDSHPEPEVRWRVERDYGRLLGDDPEGPRQRRAAVEGVVELTSMIGDPNLRQAFASVAERAALLAVVSEDSTVA